MEQVLVTMIGSGATAPTPQRALNSQLVQIGGTRVLVDCGEGTQVALRRRAATGPALIDHVVLTHYHSDHHLGIPGLIKTRSTAEEAGPLTIHALPSVARKLRRLLDATFCRDYELREIELGGRVEIASGWDMVALPATHTVDAMGVLFHERDLPGRFDAKRAQADGCPPGPAMGELARGGVLLVQGRELHGSDYIGPTRAGRKLAFSGDTRPNEQMARACAGADLLVHEATFAHEHAADARAKGHSTAVEAGEVARHCGARELWLAHLSARYSGPTRGDGVTYQDLLEQARRAAPNARVRLTHDGMHAKVSAGGAIEIIKPERGGREAAGRSQA
jgi:ribonuclease Z